MNKLLSKYSRIALRALRNYATNKPLVISFEVTHSCTCNCLHCDRGGIIEENNRLAPEDYSELVSSLNPPVVQVSGGEPLLREDVVDIVKAIKKPYKIFPYIIFVSNGSLMNREKYIELKEAGVDRFSFSLDFPNEKHDDFRRYPGLYAHLEKTIPELAELGNNDIAVNSAITRSNLPYLTELRDKAVEWGVCISYSAYGVLRTGDKDYFIYSEEEIKILEEKIKELIRIKKEKGGILNSEYNLKKTYEFFRDGQISGCKAGRRFFCVRPSGNLVPCSMKPHSREFSNHEEISAEFSSNNNCGNCYVSIRAYSSKPLRVLIKDSLSYLASK
ncbi:radical SAM protein [candidate division KSB1 bacterium]